MSDSEFRDASQLRISNTGWGGGGGGVLFEVGGSIKLNTVYTPLQML